jgi:GNAT superfamily N-acetyltransferase
MAFLLEPDNYPSVRSLFGEMTCHLAAQVVLARILPGRIYVDDPDTPKSAILIPSNRHRVYVGGEPEPGLFSNIIQMLSKEFFPQSYGFQVHYTTHTWEQTLEQVLPEQSTTFSWRQFYRLQGLSALVDGPLPENIAIRRIDESIFGDASLVNRQLLLEEVHSESPSLEHFYRHNFGFCAQDGHKLVGWCLAEYHYQGRYELGIETIEAYQRKGIATHLASTVIRHAFAQGATEIGWHCWAANTPSSATALKLGFVKALDYPVYSCALSSDEASR